eukprot:GFUD01026312.1.p1 GENE.GFUD01026312.1~~GFUD01026312.1.p1  ORF type:complete len:1657 (-),score=379.47 GFUD01026312.1:31-5001(-)
MGKKEGNAQRTKGNTKASSSSRSAQNLGQDVGFVGFGTTAESAFVPLLQSSDVDDGVPADLRLVLRKMHKKDLTTKVKALQEFLDLTEPLGEAEMLSVLPYWPSVYNKLATDGDRRVRELAHACLMSVVKGVGKNLALHLKTMCGVWYIGQSDPHAPAAQAASAAWQAAFPPSKLKGAVTFCLAEIISLITENITVATPQTLSDPKVTPVEEMEAKYVRTLAMSLTSLANLLKVATPSDEQLSNLLSHTKFWKISKHKTGSVRQAFFETLVQLGSVLPDTLPPQSKVLVPAVLPNLHDTDPSAAPAVWAAALQVLTVIPTAWEHTSPQKAVFPNIFKFISCGGEGVAGSTFPNLLPLLSKIPASIMGDQEKFLGRWFCSFKEALDSTKVRAASELSAIVTAYTECLMYVFSQESVNQSLKTKLLEEHLVALLIRSLSDRRVANSGLYATLATYLLAWDKAGNTKATTAALNTFFWSSLTHSLTAVVEEGGDLEPYITMISKIGSAGKAENISSLSLLVFKLWTMLTDQLKANMQPEANLVYLSKLLSQYDIHNSSNLHSRIFSGEGAEEQFLTTQIVPFLTSEDLLPAASSLIWSVVKTLDCDRAGVLLTEMCTKDSSSSLTVQHILTAAGPSARTSETVKVWLANSEMVSLVIKLIVEILDNLAEGKNENTVNRNTIKSIFGAGMNFSAGNLENIVRLIINGLEKGDSGDIPKYLDFVCELLILVDVKPIWNCGIGADLVLNLFTMDDGSWSTTIQKKMESVWMKCVRQVGLESLLVIRMVDSVRKMLQENMTGNVFYRCISKCENLLNIAGDQKSGCRFILSLMPEWDQLEIFSNQALYQQVFTQSLWLSQPIFPVVMDEAEKMPSLARPRVSLFLCNLLATYLGFSKLELACEDSDGDTIPDCDRNELEEEMVMHLVQVVASTCYLENIKESSAFNEAEIEVKNGLERKSRQLVSRLDKETCRVLQHKLRGLSLSEGGLWSDALAWLVRLQYKSSEWDLRLPSLLPRVDSWSDGELATAVQVLQIAKDVNSGCGMVTQTATVESGRMMSLGGLISAGSEPLLWLVTRCVVLASNSQLDTLKDEVAAVLDTLLVFRADSEERLLYSRNICDISWAEANTVACVANFLACVVTRCPDVLSAELWDLASCSLVSWCSSLEESQTSILTRPAVMLVAVAVCRLAFTMGELLGPLGHHPALAPPPQSSKDWTLPHKLREEWAEFFSEGVFSVLLPVFVTVSSSPDPNSISSYLMTELGSALVHCPAPLLLSVTLTPLFLVQDVDSPQLPDSITFLYNHIGPLLLSPCRHTQVTAGHILAGLAKATADAEDFSGEEEEKEVPRRLLEAITKGTTILENLLSEFNVGETAGTIPPGNLTHTVTMGYLLAWRVVLCLIEQAGEELRPKYSEFLRSQGHLEQLLNHLFRLLPTSSVALETSFFTVPLLVTSDASSLEIQQLSGSCWVSVCRHLPALARQWWQGLDKTAKDMVEKVTCSTVAPMLWREEATAIAGAEATDNMTLKVRDSVKEVVATYTIDEGSMELVVSLPSNHPLGGLTVESGRRVGVDTGQWRKWMLQLTTFLTHQNGTILDGLNLWKRNVDKRFEGVEECYICFYILHGSNHQLPKLGCRTCKKKFHSACLYKWFSTSNNSSCPLCRNLF